MKQCWASAMEIFEELDRYLTKHSIHHYALFGTLLGAVRHKGFIPWDDDIDIGMSVEDYYRFLKVAEEDPPENLYIHEREVIGTFVQKVGNLPYPVSGVSQNDWLTKYHGFPFWNSVDVFPLFHHLQDDDMEAFREECLNYVLDMFYDLFRGDEEINQLLPELEKTFHVFSLPDESKRSRLYKLMWAICDWPFKDKFAFSSAVSFLPHTVRSGREIFDSSVFQSVERMPFENILIPVPSDYDSVLKCCYGIYMERRMGYGSPHNYAMFSNAEELTTKTYGRDWVFRYSYSASDLENPLRQKKQEVSSFNEKSIQLLKTAHQQIRQDIMEGNFETACQLLGQCQELAQILGGMWENATEMDVSEVISILEAYCEDLYSVYEMLAPPSA